GTPAHDAGILAGDVILKIDGKSTDGMRLSEAVDLIQGEPGEKVTLSVRHESGEMQDIAIVRAEIKVPSVLGDLRKADGKEWDFMVDKKNKIGYIRLTGFTETSASELRDAVKELKKEGVRGRVLDMARKPRGVAESG